jgi:hypothetical protein
VKEVHQSPAYWRLRPASDLAAPYLIAVFERENPFERNDASIVPESPASRALDFLKIGVHAPLKSHLLRWLKKGDKDTFRVIARHLIAFGSDDLIPDVAVLFEHEDKSVSGWARMGALEAIKSGRAEPVFRQYVWNHCVELLNRSDAPRDHDPIRLLYALDQAATGKLLLGPSVMRSDHPLLAEALSTLNELQSPPSAEFLNAFLSDDTLQPDAIRRAALSGLIIRNDPNASVYVENILNHPAQFREEMVLAAWSARFNLRGLKMTSESAFEIYRKAGYKMDSLSPDERDMILMHYLDSEVRNGGLWQWYFNGFGCFADETRKALEKTGAKEHAKVIAAANKLFGFFGPPSNEEKMREVVDAMSDKKSQKLDELTEAWLARIFHSQFPLSI